MVTTNSCVHSALNLDGMRSGSRIRRWIRLFQKSPRSCLTYYNLMPTKPLLIWGRSRTMTLDEPIDVRSTEKLLVLFCGAMSAASIYGARVHAWNIFSASAQPRQSAFHQLFQSRTAGFRPACPLTCPLCVALA